MKNAKESSINEWIKSGFVALVPIALSRVILEMNHVAVFVKSLVMVSLLVGVNFLRGRIKQTKNNDLYIALMFILFFPAGFYYLWRYSKRSIMVKAIVCAVVFGLILAAKYLVGELP